VAAEHGGVIVVGAHLDMPAQGPVSKGGSHRQPGGPFPLPQIEKPACRSDACAEQSLAQDDVAHGERAEVEAFDRELHGVALLARDVDVEQWEPVIGRGM
jgi:hypothetical protein